MAADSSGNPLAYKISKANHHDQRLVIKTVDAITIGGRIRRPGRLGADKGYDSDRLRKECRKRHIVAVFVPRNKHEPELTNRERREQKYCRKRWQIERSFAWINFNRRIDRLLERKIKSYEMFMDLACIKHYLKLLRH